MDPYTALQPTTPVSSKCVIVTKCIGQRDAKYLHQFFPHLLSNLFGFDSSPGWGLGQQLEKYLYDQLKAFLAPQGPLFKLIARLDNENYFYEFPISCLPIAVRCSMADGVVPQYYAMKLHQLSGNDDTSFTHVSLSAFEYYFFHFAYYLIHSRTFPLVPLQSILYTDLLHEYNLYFLPPQASMQPVMSPSPTKNKSPQTLKISSKKSPPTGLTTAATSGGLGLLKLNGTSPTHPQHLHECKDAWCSESYVQVLIEFWLNQISYDTDNHSLLEYTQDQFIPSEEHCRLVRNLLKDVHFFSNGSSLYSGPVSNGYLCQATDRLRKSIVPVYFQKKVYQFLRHAFKHWSMDKTFRIILEIWLTYIQPWRYTDPSGTTSATSNTTTARTPLDPKWKDFVHDNLLFYTNLLLQFLSRSFQLDFTGNADVTLIFRVAKIFSHPNLREFIIEEECLVCNPHFFTRQNSLRSSPVSALNGLKSKFVELEGASFVYQPVFTSDTVKAVTVLLRKLESAKNSLHVQVSSSSVTTAGNTKKPVSFLRSWWNALVEDDQPSWSQPNQESDPTKCIDMITKTQQHLRQFFQLAEAVVANPLFQQQLPSGFDSSTVHAPPPTGLQQVATPTSIRPEYTSPNQLSPLGKMQIINGLRTCNSINVQYRGDPVLQPIRSYENPTLVRMLHRLSTHLNEKFCSQLTSLGRSDRLIYKLVCQLLVPPYLGTTQTQAPPHTPTEATQIESSEPFNFDSLHPRIHLRMLASYYTIAYLLFLFILGFLLGHVTIGLFLLFALFLYTVISYKRTKQKTQ